MYKKLKKAIEDFKASTYLATTGTKKKVIEDKSLLKKHKIESLSPILPRIKEEY